MAGKAGNPFQTTQGNRLSCRDQEGRRGSEEAAEKYFKSQAETWKMSCLSVWIKVCVSVSLVFFDNIAHQTEEEAGRP